MKIYKVSYQRLKQILDAYERGRGTPLREDVQRLINTYKISEEEVYIQIGEKSI